MDENNRVDGVMGAIAVGFLVGALVLRLPQLAGIEQITYPDGRVFGADFLNLWSTGRLVLEGRIGDIYHPEAFQAYEEALAGAGIGLRLWAYPPHSLFLAVPFGLGSYYLAYSAWTLLGLVSLWFGARRFGFNWRETALILISPASQLCVDNGQSGNFAAGLLLMALASVRTPAGLAPVAAAILTIKPQLGFLLPVFWALQGRWRDIAWATVLTLMLAGLSLWAFGPTAWSTYVGETLPMLSALERHGSGPFMQMIPSVFMSMRIVTGDPDLAIIVHIVWAVAVGGLVLWRMVRLDDPVRRAGLVLVGTVLLTPYVHNYDLTLLVCGALLVLRRYRGGSSKSRLVRCAVVGAYVVPVLVMGLNLIGLPLSPLLMLPLAFLV